MRKLIILTVFLCLGGIAFSQGHLENFDDGNTTGWGGQADYNLSNTGTELLIEANKVSTWNSFTYSFSSIDISANPYVSLKVKTDVDFNLNFFINTDQSYAFGGAGNYVEILHSDDYVEYTFDFSGAQAADLSSANVLNFVFNPAGSMGCRANVHFDDLRIGDQAVVSPNITNIQEQFHAINAGAVTVPFWGVTQIASGDVSISATSSNTSLIPNPTVTYSSPDATGSLSYTPVTDATGTATITVTVSEVGATDNVFTFDVNVEQNLAPEIDQADDANVVAGAQNDIIITGIGDGNPNANQSITITATSSNTAVVPNPTVVYSDGDFTGVIEITPGAGQTGTETITVTVTDDGGTVGGGVNTTTMLFDVTVYEAVNRPPMMKEIKDISILADSPEQEIIITGIDDGDLAEVQGMTITTSSSNTALIPNVNVDYASGLNSGKLLFTSAAGQTGTSIITVTLTDDGGAANNNGNESVEYTFEIEVRVRPITGWSDDFEDGVLGSQWPDNWVGPGEGAHNAIEANGELEIQIDKTRTNNKWAGLWFNIPNELDLSNSPYISIRMKIDPSNVATTDDMLIFLWDAYDHYNTSKTIRYTVTDTYVEYYFDYTDPSYHLQNGGATVDISRIKALLFNFDPGGSSPLLQGSFYFDDLRIGTEANTQPITPNVSINAIPDQVAEQDAGAQVINLSNIFDGAGDVNTVTLSVSSSNTTVVPNPVASSVSNQAATLTYTPAAGQTGKSTITVTAAAAGSISKVVTFDIDVLALSAGNAADITIDLSTEYQEIDGFGAFMGSGGTVSDHIIDLAEDIGMSMARIGLIGGDFELVNDNSDPNIINLDAFNPSALSIENIRRIAPFVDKFILTVWSPAAWMKKNKTERGVETYAADNILEPRHYEEYAEHIIAAIKVIQRETGVTLYGIGLQNEPQFNEPYASCKVGPNEFRDLIKVVGARLDAEGLGDVQLYFAEALPAQGALDDYINAVKNDAIAEGYADIAALHNYDADGASVGGAGCTTWGDFYNWANTGGTGSQYKTWMTETSGHEDSWDGAMTLAGNIFNALECGNASAWVFWSFDVSEGSSQYGLVVSNKPSSRYFVSKQYYKFIRPGAVRVDVNSAGIPSIAFKDDVAGTVTVILFNNTTSATQVEIAGTGLPSYWESYTTSESRNCEKGVSVGADGLIMLPASSVTTLVGYSNVPPSLDQIADEEIPQNSPTQTINLTGISDGEAGAQTLTITAVSDNQALIPNPVITYTNGNATGTLEYTPATGLTGKAIITLTLTDDGSPVGITTQTFTIEVTNASPTIDAISAVSLDVNAGLQTVNLSGITDGDASLTQSLTVTATSSNTSIVPNPTVNYTSDDATGTLTFTPVTDAAGMVTITVRVTDDGGAFTEVEFPVSIDFNLTPTLSAIATPDVVLEDHSSTVTINLAGISDGGDGGQALTVTAKEVTAGGAKLENLSVSYTSPSATATLTYDILGNVNGDAVVYVSVKDDGGNSNGATDSIQLQFIQSITSVNDAPTIDPISNTNLVPGVVNLISISNVTDGDSEINQTLSGAISFSKPELFLDNQVDFVDNVLAIKTVDNAEGTVTITVTISDDGGTSNGGVNQTVISFDATIGPDGILTSGVDNILVYPNPSTGFVNIKMNDATFNTLSITDVLGKTVVSKDISGVNETIAIDLNNINPGNYILNLTGDGKYYSSMIIVE